MFLWAKFILLALGEWKVSDLINCKCNECWDIEYFREWLLNSFTLFIVLLLKKSHIHDKAY